MTLRQISEVGALPIVDLDSGDVLGQITGWVVSPEEQKVLAYLLQKSGWLTRGQIVLDADIVEYGPRMLIVNDPSAVISPEEVIGLPQLIERRSTIVGYDARDETGQSLGQVQDFVFDITSGLIQRYYVRPSLISALTSNDLVLNRDEVIEIKDRRIVFRRDALVPIASGETQIEPRLT